MKLPRNLSGERLVGLLSRYYGYRVSRQSGSHMNVTLTVGGKRHSVVIPRHRQVSVGTLNAIISAVAIFHRVSKHEVREQLFG